MLTQDQKEAILRAAGVDIPAWPGVSSCAQQMQAPDESCPARAPQADGHVVSAKMHALAINALFEQYVVQRAAKSLREADEALRLESPHDAKGNGSKSGAGMR